MNLGLRGKNLAFTAIFTMIVFVILISFDRSENTIQPIQPPWIKTGATLTYYGNLTIKDGGVLEATIRWSIKNIDLDTIDLEAVIESTSLRTPILRTFNVSIATGKIISIDDEEVDAGIFFLWLYPQPSIGDIVEIEGIPYRVSGIELVNASNRIWRCVIVNSTLNDYHIHGVVTRWYDVETGIQVKVYMDLSFIYFFKGENTTSSAKADLILVSASL